MPIRLEDVEQLVEAVEGERVVLNQLQGERVAQSARIVDTLFKMVKDYWKTWTIGLPLLIGP